MVLRSDMLISRYIPNPVLSSQDEHIKKSLQPDGFDAMPPNELNGGNTILQPKDIKRLAAIIEGLPEVMQAMNRLSREKS